MRASDIQTDGEIWVCLFTIFVWNFDRGETGEQDRVDRRESCQSGRDALEEFADRFFSTRRLDNPASEKRENFGPGSCGATELGVT